MKILSLIVLFFLLLLVTTCSNSTNNVERSSKTVLSPDTLQVDTTSNITRIKEYVANENRQKQNSLFLLSIFSVTRILEADEGCNRLTARYLIHLKKKNKDSIMLAMQIFTDSVFANITDYRGCPPRKCILSIFETEKNFRTNNWLALGTRFSREEAKISYRSEIMEQYAK